MHGSREWLHERFRRDKRQSPEPSGWALARKYRVSRNAVAKALRLEDFEFEENPDVSPEPIGELRNPAWVSGGRALVLLISIGTAVTQTGLTARYTRKGAEPFQIVTERKERKATAMASNTPLRDWDKTFTDLTDPRLCAAIADRLTFERTLVKTGTSSCRLKAAEYEYRSARRS